MERHSVYLKEKCYALAQAIDFFFGGNGKTTSKERRLVFLAQIDFWDWEMAELIFTFETFKDRSKIWESGITNAIKHTNFVIKNDVIEGIKDSNWHKYWCNYKNDFVTAPIEDLNKVIQKWNELLNMIESTTLIDKQQVEKCGMFGVIADLSLYKKNVLEV